MPRSKAANTNFNDLIENIFNGNYSQSISTSDFKRVLNESLFVDCDKSNMKKTTFSLECTSPNQRNVLIYGFLSGALEQAKLNNLFDFFNIYLKNNLASLASDTINNLISLGIHFNKMFEIKIIERTSTYYEKDILTISSFLNFLSNLLSIPSIFEFETPGLNHQRLPKNLPNITFGEMKKIDNLVSDSIKLTEDLTHILAYKKYNYTMESLLSFLESLGNLGFQLKIKEDFQDIFHNVNAIAKGIIQSENVVNFSKEQKGRAGYAFLVGFDNKDETDIKADCKSLLELEDCPRPITESTRLFQQIANGNYTNQSPSYIEYTKVQNEIKGQMDSLKRDQSIHILAFLKNVLKTNNGAENSFNFQQLYQFAFNRIQSLNKDLQLNNMLNDSFAQAAENLSYFIFNIVKKNTDNNDLLDQIHVIDQFSKLFENIIIRAPHLHSLIETTTNHLFSILARNIDSEAALQTGHSQFLNIIKNINKVCRDNPGACNQIKILAGSFKSLGSISRKTSGYAVNATKEAQALIEETNQKNLSTQQLADAVSFFFKANISQDNLNRDCKQKFNLTGCRPANTINFDDSVYGENEMTTTLLPNEHWVDNNNISSTTSIAATSSTTELPLNTNSTSSNQITVDTSTKKNSEISLLNSGLPIAAAATHGLLGGIGNGIIQYFANKYSLHGERSTTAKTTFIYLGMGFHAALNAALPMIIEYINQGDKEQAKELMSDLLLETGLPTFLISVATHLALQLVIECTKLVSKRVEMVARNTFSLFGITFNLYHQPVTTVVQVGTSTVSSFFTYGLLNRISPPKSQQSLDIEATEKTKVTYNAQNGIAEIQPLNEKNETKSNGNINNSEKELTREEIFFEENKFISLENFNKLSNYLVEIIKKTQEFSNMHYYQPPKDLLELRLSELRNILERFNLKDFIKAPDKNTTEEQQFKRNCDSLKFLIQTLHNQLQTNHFFYNDRNLKAALNKIEGLNSKYTSEYTCKLREIRENMGFIDTVIKAALGPTIDKVDNSKSKTPDNRRNTICFYSSGSDGEARFSVASSSDESTKSDGYGNSALNDIQEQQQEPLMNTRLHYS